MMFTAYVDESGTHPGSDTIALGGYVSNEAGWQAFERDWRWALAQFGLSRFHMVEFAHFRGEFAGWEEERRQACFDLLAKIIKANTLGSVATSFSRADYEATFSVEADRHVGGPYGLAATMTFMALGDVFNKIGAYGSIAYIYEAGAIGAGQVLKTFQENLADAGQKHALRLNSLDFKSKADFVPLQAADILAYEWNLQLARARGDNPRAFRRTLRLLGGEPHEWGIVSRDNLAMFGQVVHLRTTLAPDQLALPTPGPRSTGTMLAITEEEFKARWKWWHDFKGSRLELGRLGR